MDSKPRIFYGHPELVRQVTFVPGKDRRVFGRQTFDVLITEKEISDCCDRLGKQIATDLGDQDVVVVGMPKGALFFLADLMRAIGKPYAMDLLGVSSYGSGTESTGKVRITSDLSAPVEGKIVLLVEDIMDTGQTMKATIRHVSAKRPLDILVCSLLCKPDRLMVDKLRVDYAGFVIPNVFVAGYGLDMDEDGEERYRGTPYIGVPVIQLP